MESEYEMESVFEPAVRMEETPEARTVIVDLPGFRKENLKVEIDKRGSLIVSGERDVKEMEEMTKVGGTLEKQKRGSQRFRMVINIPEKLQFERCSAKFRDETLRIFLPFLDIAGQQNQVASPASVKPDQSVQSKVESSSPLGQEDSMKERSGFAEDNKKPRHPEGIQQDDVKEKASAAEKESKGFVKERKTEAPKHAQDSVHEEPPISKEVRQERSHDQSTRKPEPIRPDDHKAKPIAAAVESKKLVEAEMQKGLSMPKASLGEAPISKEPMQELRSAVGQDKQSVTQPEAIRSDDHKAKPIGAAGESKELAEREKAEGPKHAQDFVAGAPISKHPMQELRSAVAQDKQSATHPEARPDDHKAKPIGAARGSKELVERVEAEAHKHGQEFINMGGASISKDPMQERSTVAQDDQIARHSEAIPLDDDKAKSNAAAEDSKELLGGKKAEVPKHAQDIVGAGTPISEKATQKEFSVADSQLIGPDDDKAKPIGAPGDSTELLEAKKKEAKHREDQSQSIESKSKQEEEKLQQENDEEENLQEENEKLQQENDEEENLQEENEKLQQENDEEENLQEENEEDEEEETDGVEGDDEEEYEDKDESSDEFPENVIQIPCCIRRSMFSKDKILIAWTVLVLSVGLYLSYILRSQSSD